MGEVQHQIAVMKWSQQPDIRKKYPELKLLFHVPNERKCTPQQGAMLKRSGVKKGVPDLILPVARGKYHGLCIELKAPNGSLTAEQEWWILELNKQDYFAIVCYGWENATHILRWYLDQVKEVAGE